MTLLTVFAGLIGAIAWNLTTWWFGLPSSSSHALIGGMVGATVASAGLSGVQWDGLVEKVMVPALVAPVLAMVAAGLAILVAYRIIGRQSPGVVSRGFRLGQWASSALFSLSHGTNDAQKTMGIIFLALIANGNMTADDAIPNWVVVSSATAIALGTYFGGWRIVRTMGSRIIKMDPAQGFAAQGVGSAVILSASHVGFPLSTTHVMSGAIMGAGAAKRLSAVRWGVAGNIFVAWILTLPCSAAVGALTYGVVRIFGTGSAGPAGGRRGAAARPARVLRAPAVERRGACGERAMRLAVVEVGQIFEVIWVSLIAGVGLTFVYSFVVLGTGRSAEARRTGRGGVAFAYGALAVVSLVAFAAMIVLGVQVMLTKD